MLTEKDFPTINDLLPYLVHLPKQVERGMHDCEDDTPCIDVRLQVQEDGDWNVHTGSAQYDTDHSGFWGASSVEPDDDHGRLLEIASELLDQAIEDARSAGALLEDVPETATT